VVSSFTYPPSIYDEYGANLIHDIGLDHDDKNEKFILVDQSVDDEDTASISMVSQPIYDDYHEPSLEGYTPLVEVIKCQSTSHVTDEVASNFPTIELSLSKRSLVSNHVRPNNQGESFLCETICVPIVNDRIPSPLQSTSPRDDKFSIPDHLYP